VIEARLQAGDPGMVTRLRLRRMSGSAGLRARTTVGTVASPALATIAGSDLVVRLNVMRGPDLDPLATGRWRLELGPRLPVAIANPAAIDRSSTDAQFQVTSSKGYRVVTSVASDGSLCLDVQIVRSRAPWAIQTVRANFATRIARHLTRVAKPLVFQVLFRAFRLFHRPPVDDRRRIVFMADSRAELAGNLRLIHDRMTERGLNRDHDLVPLLKGRVTERRRLADRLRLPSTLASADVIVIDDYQPPITHIPASDDLRIVQLWHASGAFKTVGYSRIGKHGGPNAWSRIHKNYSAAIVSSDHDVPFYAEAFGIPESRVVPTGIPRMDRFFDLGAADAARRAALDEFPAVAGHDVILIAPTFRGTGPANATYPFDQLDLEGLRAACVERDAVALIKMHPFVRERLEVPPGLADRVIDVTTSRIDVNDLLFSVHLLVTDYSSIIFEYSTLGRPMIFYAYDLDEYVAERDFYVPYEDFVPGPIVRTFDELLAEIRHGERDVEPVRAFAGQHFAHPDGGSTDRVIDQLILAG
jgi:CDP-ribitol ribitolphosphotransferase / teichoic acid ribitol-phosphate polymerase